MEFTVDQFNQIKHEAEEAYNKIGYICCPYFKNEKVSASRFNSMYVS